MPEGLDIMDGWGKKLVYRLRSSFGGDGKRIYSVFTCADDVEHKRHRRNPFHDKYLQAVLSTFETIGEVDRKSISRFEVDAASMNVHVRMELIKSMKENLAKSASDAVRYHKAGLKRTDQKLITKRVSEGRLNIDSTEINECKGVSFICDNLYNLYCLKFGSFYQNLRCKNRKYRDLTPHLDGQRMSYEPNSLLLDLDEAANLLEFQIKENSNYLENAHLCIELDIEITEALESILRPEAVRNSTSDADLAGDADISMFQKHIKPVTKELILDDSSSETEDDDTNLILQANKETLEFFSAEMNNPVGDTEVSSTGSEFSDKEPYKSVIKNVGISGDKSIPTILEKGGYPYSERDNTKQSEDADSIEEFGDDITKTQEIHERSYNLKWENEGMDLLGVTDLSDIEYIFQFIQIPESAHSEQKKARLNSVIQLNPEDVMKFYNTKVKQRKKKLQWFVSDVEKLLEHIEYSDNYQRMDSRLESRQENILIGHGMFATSLSRPFINFLEHCKRHKGSPTKIPGGFHYKSVNGDEDIDISQTEHHSSDTEVSGGTTYLSGLANQNDLPTEELIKDRISSKHPSNAQHELAVKWDNISELCDLNLKPKNIAKELTLTTDADCSIRNNNLSSSNIIDVSCFVQDFEQCFPFNVGGTEIAKPETSVKPVASDCVLDDARDGESLHLKSVNENGILKQLSSYPKDECNGVERSENLGDLTTETTEISMKIASNSISLEHSEILKSNSANDSDNTFLHTDVISFERICCTVPNTETKFSNGAVGFSDLKQSEVLYRNGSKQADRKRQRINDLIADMVRLERESRQQASDYFDLVPLSVFLETGISSLHGKEHMPSIKFDQLLLNLNVDLNCGNGNNVKIQRYFMALLSLAHQQNNGTFKGSFPGACQIYVWVPSNSRLHDIVIDFHHS